MYCLKQSTAFFCRSFLFLLFDGCRHILMSSSRKIFLAKNALAYDALLTSSRGHGCTLMKYFSHTSIVLSVKRCLPTLSARIHATNFVQFSSTSEKPILGALLQESPYQLMKRIKDVELIPSFSDSNPNLLSEQMWVQDFLKNEITEEELIERTKNLEKKNNHRRDQSTKFTDSEVIKSTERWIKDFIIAMGLCPYASGGFEKKRSIHASQTTGLFIASEWIDLHAQHLVVEKEMVTKLLVFHNRIEYGNFKDMCDILSKSPVMNNLIDNQMIKMAIFHPKALNSLYMEDDARHFLSRSPFATIQLTRMKEQRQVIKTWERKNRDISPNYDGTKTISSIINDNNSNFSKKSDQKLQFLFDSFLPVTVIVCPVQESFDANTNSETHIIK